MKLGHWRNYFLNVRKQLRKENCKSFTRNKPQKKPDKM